MYLLVIQLGGWNSLSLSLSLSLARLLCFFSSGEHVHTLCMVSEGGGLHCLSTIFTKKLVKSFFLLTLVFPYIPLFLVGDFVVVFLWGLVWFGRWLSEFGACVCWFVRILLPFFTFNIHNSCSFFLYTSFSICIVLECFIYKYYILTE